MKPFRIKPQWIPRTHDLIELVDELPRDRTPAFFPKREIITQIKKQANLTNLICFANDEVLRVLHPETTLYVLNPKKLQQREAFLFSINPRTTSAKAVRNIILYIKKFKIRSVLISPTTRHSHFYSKEKIPAIEFPYGNWNFEPTGKQDRIWLKNNRYLIASATYFNHHQFTTEQSVAEHN